MANSSGKPIRILILSVLGTSNYTPVAYIHKTGARREHRFFQKTLHDHIRETNPDADVRINVLLTEEARRKNWAPSPPPGGDDTAATPDPTRYLHTELGGGDGMDIAIPKGANEGELWEIFNTVVQAVWPGERVVLDVTHGFRTQPMLLLLAAGYLRTAKQITLDSVVYGAYEQGRDDADVFELTPFITLFDWATAVDAYTRSGDTRLLADRLRAGIVQALPEAQTALTDAAVALESFGDALDLARPRDALNCAYAVVTYLEAAKPYLGSNLTPFLSLIDRLLQDLAPFALHSDGFATDDGFAHFLDAQLHLAKQLLGWRRFYAASIILREWMVSYALYVTKEATPTALLENLKKARDGERRRENITSRLSNGAFRGIYPHLDAAWAMLKDEREENLRNELAHGSHVATVTPVKDIADLLTRILAELEKLPPLPKNP